jgi:hypothetical protein
VGILWVAGIVVVLGIVGAVFAAIHNDKVVKEVTRRVHSRYKIDEIYVSVADRSLVGIGFDSHKIILGAGNFDAAYNFSQIVAVALVENGTTVTQTSRGSQLLSAAVGGVAFGAVGAIVGGLSGSSRSRERLRGIALKVTVDDRLRPVHTIIFLRSSNKNGLDPGGLLAKLALSSVNRFHAHILNAMRQAQAKVAVAPVAFAPDDLQKLWDMKQAGILTEEEFAGQKARLLGKLGQSESESGIMPPRQHRLTPGPASFCSTCGSSLISEASLFCSSCGSTVQIQQVNL